MENSKISWTTHTFNPWRGCTKVSPGCTNCYAETLSGRNPRTLGVWGPKGTRVVAVEARWREPVKWNRIVSCNVAHGGPRPRVFCASLADVFEDWKGPMADSKGDRLFVDRMGSWRRESENVSGRPWEPLTMDGVRERLFDLIRATPNLDWLLLTKRPERWRACWPLDKVPGHVSQNEGDGKRWAKLPNVWLGTSVEDRRYGLPRIDHLRATPAAVRFLSLEPLLEDLGTVGFTGIHWAIIGGESGGGARPFDFAWARSLVKQCKAAGVACFVKQLGGDPYDTTEANRLPSAQKQYPFGTEAEKTEAAEALGEYFDHVTTLKLRDRKGGTPSEWPADLRVREFPCSAG